MPELEQIVSAVTFTGVRIGGLMVFAPFTGDISISATVKAVLTLLVTAVVYPVAPVAAITVDATGWLKVAASEAVIGLALGMLLQLSLEAAQFGGQMLGMQTGFSLVTLLDPQSEADSPSLVVFARLITMLIFLQLNVHHWMLRSVAASFTYLPPGSLPNLGMVSAGLAKSAASMWLAGLQVAAPVLAVTFLVDITLGFIGRVAPQLPATLAGLPVKSVLGLLVMALAVRSWPHIFEKQFTAAIVAGERMLHLAY